MGASLQADGTHDMGQGRALPLHAVWIAGNATSRAGKRSHQQEMPTVEFPSPMVALNLTAHDAETVRGAGCPAPPTSMARGWGDGPQTGP
jgi:hypothetical protein